MLVPWRQGLCSPPPSSLRIGWGAIRRQIMGITRMVDQPDRGRLLTWRPSRAVRRPAQTPTWGKNKLSHPRCYCFGSEPLKDTEILTNRGFFLLIYPRSKITCHVTQCSKSPCEAVLEEGLQKMALAQTVLSGVHVKRTVIMWKIIWISCITFQLCRYYVVVV